MAYRTPWLVPGLFLLASGTIGCGIEATGDLDAAAQQSAGGQGGSAGASPGVGGSSGGAAGDSAGSGGDGGSDAGSGGADAGSGGEGGEGGASGEGGEAGEGGGAGAGQAGAAEGGTAGVGGSDGGEGGASGDAGQGGDGGDAGQGGDGGDAGASGDAGAGGMVAGAGGDAGQGGDAGAAGVAGVAGAAGGGNGGEGGASGGMAGAGAAGEAGAGGDAGAGVGGSAGAGGQTTTLCGKANEESNPKSVTLTCPANEVIVEVVFASYGLPGGNCGSFSQGNCHAANSKAKVEALCLHKASCKVDANNATFGDPCKGADKRLSIEVKCGAPSLTCGDGTLDPGEACDAGGAATMACSGTCGLTCAGGFLSDDNGSCYSTTGKKSWQAARDECVAKGAGCDLAVLETAAERSFLKGKFGAEAWVGGFKSDSGWQDMPAYTWVDFSPWTGGGPAAKWVANSSNGGGPDGSSWTGNEPNNILGERCLRLKDSDLKLLTSNCADTGQGGICECKVPGTACNHDGKLDPGEECDDGNLVNGDGCSTGCTVECAPLDAAHFTVKDPTSGHCYAALKQETPWNNAGNACSALGPRYHLARVDSLAEFQFLSVASWARLSVPGGPGTPTLWLDGNDLGNEGSFVTSLGGPIPFENKKFPWATNEPNNIGEEDCLSLNWFTLDNSTAYLLNDSNCTWSFRPLCERE